jgi:hypothetical protein
MKNKKRRCFERAIAFIRRHPSSSICWAEAVDKQISSQLLSCRQNITYSWINMGHDTTLADYDISEQFV